VSVTAPKGFVASGVASGIKPSGDLDLSLVATASRAPVAAAAVFTQNKMTAAPVVATQAHLTLTDGRAAAVVLNSGCANAATGALGLADAQAMCAAVAGELGCAPEEVLVCSTGLIGYRLPMDAVLAGIPKLAAALDVGGAADAAEAIRTTDTHRKETMVEGVGFVVGGMAKGAAMLAPGMATMLAVLTTDAALEPGPLTDVLRAGVAESFNAMSSDGCTSTNDTVVLLAISLWVSPR
jgi:glutamate N-acetyltransferase/amino-acid N-acetyltransferase